jgi:excinuclease ABC subunit B
MGQTKVADMRKGEPKAYVEPENISVAADPVLKYLTEDQIRKNISSIRKQIEKAVKELDFIQAASLRDELFAMEDLLKTQENQL